MQLDGDWSRAAVRWHFAEWIEAVFEGNRSPSNLARMKDRTPAPPNRVSRAFRRRPSVQALVGHHRGRSPCVRQLQQIGERSMIVLAIELDPPESFQPVHSNAVLYEMCGLHDITHCKLHRMTPILPAPYKENPHCVADEKEGKGTTWGRRTCMALLGPYLINRNPFTPDICVWNGIVVYVTANQTRCSRTLNYIARALVNTIDNLFQSVQWGCEKLDMFLATHLLSKVFV